MERRRVRGRALEERDYGVLGLLSERLGEAGVAAHGAGKAAAAADAALSIAALLQLVQLLGCIAPGVGDVVTVEDGAGNVGGGDGGGAAEFRAVGRRVSDVCVGC